MIWKAADSAINILLCQGFCDAHNKLKFKRKYFTRGDADPGYFLPP